MSSMLCGLQTPKTVTMAQCNYREQYGKQPLSEQISRAVKEILGDGECYNSWGMNDPLLMTSVWPKSGKHFSAAHFGVQWWQQQTDLHGVFREWFHLQWLQELQPNDPSHCNISAVRLIDHIDENNKFLARPCDSWKCEWKLQAECILPSPTRLTKWSFVSDKLTVNEVVYLDMLE